MDPVIEWILQLGVTLGVVWLVRTTTKKRSKDSICGYCYLRARG